ncbi:MAG: hypothetical protein K6V97_08390 [Actinomycetia bacterium]|nr:hypothetical protein [Actinomycetes bacterium]
MPIPPAVVSQVLSGLAELAGVALAYVVVAERPRVQGLLEAHLGKAQADRFISEVQAADHLLHVILPGALQATAGMTEEQASQEIAGRLIQVAHTHGLSLTGPVLDAALNAGVRAFRAEAAKNPAQIQADAKADAEKAVAAAVDATQTKAN